jgi:hypothetical protein
MDSGGSSIDYKGGYLYEAHHKLMDAWKDYITRLKTGSDALSQPNHHYKWKDEDFALTKIVESLGVFDMKLSFDQLYNDVRAQTPGDMDDFARKHMTMGAQVCGTFGQRDRDFRFFYDGMEKTDYLAKLGALNWCASDAEFVTPWFTPAGNVNKTLDNSAYWSDYYSRWLGYEADGVTEKGITRRVSIENSDNFGDNDELQNDESMGWGFYSKLIARGDDAISLWGVNKSFAEQFFVPSKEGTPDVFLVPAELDSGVCCIHQHHMPLVDTEDPYQCGFYVLLSDEDDERDNWSKFFSRSARTIWPDVKANMKDAIVYVGDAIGIHPALHFPRPNLSMLPYQETDTRNGDGFDWADIFGLLPIINATNGRYGISHPFKPVTAPMPMEISQVPSDFVNKSQLPDYSDMPWVQWDGLLSWTDVVGDLLDASTALLHTPSDDIPFDILAKLNWFWFRRGPSRFNVIGTNDDVGFGAWMTALPEVVVTNWMTDRKHHFYEAVSNVKEMHIDLASIDYEASPIDFTAPGSPISLRLDKFQREWDGKKQDSRGGSGGRRRSSKSYSSRSRGNSKPSTPNFTRMDKSEKGERYPESDDVVKGAPDTIKGTTTDGEFTTDFTTKKKRKMEEAKGE